MDINIDNKIDIWKNKLLDLGKRNRLINYRQTKRSTLSILQPEIYELWESFVKNENSIIFPKEDELNDNDNNEVALLTSYGIKTNQDIREMQKTLRNLRNKAKMVAEEQGINTLYLAFGFLNWTESSYSNETITSPLILVPVKLTVNDITSPYVLSFGDDEIVLNPSLRYKLENDFGITLSDFDEEGDLKHYFNKLKTEIKNSKWSIVEEVGLSLFSFLKINMYSDLENHKKIISSNPIVRAICGDVSAIKYVPENLNNFDFDAKIKPTDTYQIVDADSSQQEAILCAKKGVSFVLQGPPGTGKSQTITNIIAECLADGKKVLFVSEKMAALDVVYKRLSAAGLDDFCLVLHSYKTNKKAVLEQLGNALSLARSKAQLSSDAYFKLDALYRDKEKLNQYSQQIFAEVAPFGKSIYWVNGIIANLNEYDDVIFSIPEIRSTTYEKYNRYLYVLNELKNTIGRLTEDYENNPWCGANVEIVTNELRHDIGARFPLLSEKLKISGIQLKSIFSKADLKLEETYSNLEAAESIFSLAKRSPIIPYKWIMGEEITPLLNEITECEQNKNIYLKKVEELNKHYKCISNNNRDIVFNKYEDYLSDDDIGNALNRIRTEIQKNRYYAKIEQDQILPEYYNQINKAKEKVYILIGLRKKIIKDFEKEIFGLDYKPILQRFKTEYDSVLKYFKSNYKEDKKNIKVCYKNTDVKLDDNIILQVLLDLQKIDEINESISRECVNLLKLFGIKEDYYRINFCYIDCTFNVYRELKICQQILLQMKNIITYLKEKETRLSNHFEFLYNGINTSWTDVRQSLNWAIEFRKIVKNYHLNESFVQKICSDTKEIEKCDGFECEINQIKKNISSEFYWFLGMFYDKEKLNNLNLLVLSERIQKCANGLFLLEEWIDFVHAKKDCEKEGLSEYVNQIEIKKIESYNIIPIFQKRFFRLWLDSVSPEYPAVQNFRRLNQENTIHEFAKLDKMQFEIAKARIKSKLINDLPILDKFTSGMDEISILKHELSKQRRIMPIRKLFKNIPNLLLTLKPCLMMSPLSVSLFLEADTYKFDTVIFDEASQVCSENAIGAIARGKQVIIAGDSKQLPPTNFFTASSSDSDFDFDRDDDEYEDDSNSYESILDEANLLPERTLLWHYRSRNEYLIAFSNTKIYHNNLITFPSNVDNAPDNGVEYIYVENGFYDRGGKKGNVIEAQKIAELVFEHFSKFPDRSLGVIAFGEVQQQAIETAIREKRLKNQEFEDLFNEEKEEAFFVKNLENVQGDERDTIIFSIGYAKDASGVFRMNFGPLSKTGGERRLNVAITRAKYNIKLVGSILPTDIDIDKISSEGPKLLRSYIDFAINGICSLQKEITVNDIVEHDSPFEKAVYDFLDRKGYKLATQVGCSGYRIDMAVKHPVISGQYVLGIECDGAAYHSARTARERDRLRQDVLEKMGWKIYRIWSTDWIKDPITEGNLLINAIEDALKNYGIQENYAVKEKKLNESFVSLEEKTLSIEEIENPYEFKYQEEISFLDLPYNDWGEISGTDCVMRIINKMYPVHYDLICKEMAPLYGNLKATVKVRREVNSIIDCLQNMIIQKGEFFYPKEYSNVFPYANNSRKIEYISDEELAAAMYYVLKKSVGLTKDILCSETARSYNFNRMTQNIVSAMNRAFDLLLSAKIIHIVEGKIEFIK